MISSLGNGSTEMEKMNFTINSNTTTSLRLLHIFSKWGRKIEHLDNSLVKTMKYEVCLPSSLIQINMLGRNENWSDLMQK